MYNVIKQKKNPIELLMMFMVYPKRCRYSRKLAGTLVMSEETVNQFSTNTFMDQLAQNTVTSKPKKIPRTKNLPPAAKKNMMLKIIIKKIQNERKD